MASCNIIRNSRGQVEYTEAPNGARSFLYDALVNKIQDSEEALRFWLVSKTKGFIDSVVNPLKRRGNKTTEAVISPIRIQSSELIYSERVNPFTNENMGDLELNLVKVDTTDRGQGLAKRAIGKFLDYADTIGKPTYLVIAPREAGVTEEGLIKLYSSFGYKLSETGFEMTRPVGKRQLPEVLEGMDVNGEPTMPLLLNYVDNLSSTLEKEPSSLKELTEEEADNLREVMIGLPVNSSSELSSLLNRGFLSEGYFNPSRESLSAINIYSNEEITDILSDENLLENIRSFIYTLNNSSGEVLNDVYVDDNFLVVKDGSKNNIGKFKLDNPYIVEKSVVDVLGGIQTREEFERVIFNDDSVAMLSELYTKNKGTNEDLFNKFKKFSKVAIVTVEEGGLTTKLSNTRELLEQTLIEPEDTGLEDQLDYLIELDSLVFSENPKAVNKLVKEVSKSMRTVGLDTTELESKLQGKSIGQFKGFLQAVSSFIKLETPQAFDNLVAEYDEFFDANKDFKFKSVLLSNNISSDNSFSMSTVISNIELFGDHGLIPIGKGVFKRVSKSKPLEEVYDSVYTNTVTNGYNNILSDEAVKPTGYDEDGTLNLSKIMDINNKASIINDMRSYIQSQVAEVNTGNYNATQEDLERYILLFNYYNRSSDLNKFNEKPVVNVEYSTFLEDIGNQDYLKTDFIADFNIKKLNAKASKDVSYDEFFKHFEIDNTGIRLVNQDPITLSNISKYLEDNKDLVNYLKLHKQGVTLAMGVISLGVIEDDLFHRNYYTNFPSELKAFKGDYNNIYKGVLLAKTKEPFIKVKEGVFELINSIGNQGVYGELSVNEGAFKQYNTSLQPPTVDINLSELTAIDVNIESETEFTNLYSEEEKNQIDNEHDNC